MRSGTRWRALLAFLLVLPIVEVVLMVQVARWIGIGPMLLTLVALSLLGGWIVKVNSRRAFAELRASAGERRPPERTISNRVLTVVGGLLLLVPGFVSSVLALPFFLPFTRPLLRRGASGWAVRRGSMFVATNLRTGPPRDTSHHVVHGEVIDGGA